jgi:DNA polymerase-3 subunit epsilon
MPHRQATEKQLAALSKAREALVKKHTCERCSWEDPARGLQKHSDDRIYNTTRDGVTHRYCISCRIYFRWTDTRQQIEQDLHTLFAEHTQFYVLDTETTGKLESQNGQIVEIAILDQDGQVVYHTLCKPDSAMPASVSEINGLTDDVLAEAPSFAQIWPDLMQVLTANDTPIYVWNTDFDRPMLLKTAQRFQLPVPETISNKKRWRCAMKLHARWYGEWSNGKDDYRWQPLQWACTDLEIEGDDWHRAIGDAQHTLGVMQAIAKRDGKYPPPEEMPYHQRYYGD